MDIGHGDMSQAAVQNAKTGGVDEIAESLKKATIGEEGAAGPIVKSEPATDIGHGDMSQAAVQNVKTGNVAEIAESLKKVTICEDHCTKCTAAPIVKREPATVPEEDLDATSSSSDDSNMVPVCSYPYGYIKRQTVYACLTCNDPSKPDWKPAGVCIGCRYACHQDHEVISMETRRNFRCDCGTQAFPNGTSCILCPEKDPVNTANIYNGNFKGTFCTCNCKEADCNVEDPLYQCVVCEDWFHAGHAAAQTAGIEKNYTDLVCGGCIAKLDFLRYYEPFDATSAVTEDAVMEMIKLSEVDEKEAEDTVCKLSSLTQKLPFTSGQLWTLGWRGKLCRCGACKKMYADLSVSFLLDKDDETRRYFEDDDDEEAQDMVCQLVRRFEEWLFKMDPQERIAMFQQTPEEVKAKLREYFSTLKDEMGAPLEYEDCLLNQLFDSFAEFILNEEGGADYLLDVDALEEAFEESKEDSTNEPSAANV